MVDAMLPPKAFWHLVVGTDPEKIRKWQFIVERSHWDRVSPESCEDEEHYYAGIHSSFNWFKIGLVEV